MDIMDCWVTPDDLERAGEVAVDQIKDGVAADWDASRAGTLTWSIRETVVHMASTCAFYATHLAAGSRAELPVTLASAGRPDNAALLAVVSVTPRLLAAVARSTPVEQRAFHWAGMADASGFLAMGCDEVFIHTWDVARGLGIDVVLPGAIIEKVLNRLYPWAPTDVSPLEAFLWVNGRAHLKGQSREDWQPWHCAPLEEWDGTVPAPSCRDV